MSFIKMAGVSRYSRGYRLFVRSMLSDLNEFVFLKRSDSPLLYVHFSSWPSLVVDLTMSFGSPHEKRQALRSMPMRSRFCLISSNVSLPNMSSFILFFSTSQSFVLE